MVVERWEVVVCYVMMRGVGALFYVMIRPTLDVRIGQ